MDGVRTGYLRRSMAQQNAPRDCRSVSRSLSAGLKVYLCAMALVLGVSVACGQWLEKVVYLPDSLSGVLWPSCIASNPDAGKIYVSGEYDGRMRNDLDAYVIALDPHTGEKVARIPVQENVGSLCYNPVVKKLYASHRSSGRISVIDGFTDKVTATIAFDSGPDLLCCNTVNGKIYVSTERGANSIAVLDGVGDSIIRSIAVGGGPMAFDSVGNKLYCDALGKTSEMAVVDGAGDTVLTTVQVSGGPSCMAVNAAARRVYVCGYGEGGFKLLVLDADADTVLALIPGGSNIEQSLCFNELRDELYCPGPTGDTVLAIDCSGDTVARKFAVGLGYEPGSVLCLPEQDLLFCVAHADQATLRVVNLATGNVMHSEEVSNWRMFLIDRAKGKFYGVNTSKNDVTVLTASGDSLNSSRIAVGCRPSALCWASRVNKLYIGDGSNGGVYVLDCASGGVRALAPRGPFVSSLCYDSLDSKVYCSDAAESVHVIDCTTDSVVAAVKTGPSPRQMAYVPRHNRIYCANESGSMTVIDCRSDTPVRTIPLTGSPTNPLYNPERDEVLVPCRPVYNEHFVAVVDCSTNSWVDTLMYKAFYPIYCQSVKKIYMVGISSNDLEVLDAASDSLVATIPGVQGFACGVNETDSKVYAVLSFLAPFVAVIDATADTLASQITSVSMPMSVAHDVLNDKMYVPSGMEPGQVFVLDGPTDSIISSIPALGHVSCYAIWNPKDGRMYVSNTFSGSISVFRDSLVPGIQDMGASRRGRGSVTMIRQLNLLADLRQADVYDISGRRVARLGPGLGDAGRLGVGVYFVAELGQSGATKIVVVR
jgi:YVTN family beta-propeller protein